jgi:hypothetical protein
VITVEPFGYQRHQVKIARDGAVAHAWSAMTVGHPELPRRLEGPPDWQLPAELWAGVYRYSTHSLGWLQPLLFAGYEVFVDAPWRAVVAPAGQAVVVASLPALRQNVAVVRSRAVRAAIVALATDLAPGVTPDSVIEDWLMDHGLGQELDLFRGWKGVTRLRDRYQPANGLAGGPRR